MKYILFIMFLASCTNSDIIFNNKLESRFRNFNNDVFFSSQSDTTWVKSMSFEISDTIVYNNMICYIGHFYDNKFSTETRFDLNLSVPFTDGVCYDIKTQKFEGVMNGNAFTKLNEPEITNN